MCRKVAVSELAVRVTGVASIRRRVCSPTKGNSNKELARRSKLIGSRAISFPRSKVHPFAETILHQKGGRGPMASEESQLHMLSTSGASPVMQS